MSIYLKVISVALISVILYLVVQQQEKSFAIILSLCLCSVILISAISYWKPVLEFWNKLQKVANLDSHQVKILMKVVGIGVLSDIAETICADSGNHAMAKGIQYLSISAILWLSLPMLEELLKLLNNILDKL